jgi:hypothetical protein
MHKSAKKCNETLGKWCKNKHGASKIMDTLETYQGVSPLVSMPSVSLQPDRPRRYSCSRHYRYDCEGGGGGVRDIVGYVLG